MVNMSDTKHAWVKQALSRMNELGLSQQDLTDVFDVSTRSSVNHYFMGRQTINITQLKKLSKKLGCSLSHDPDNEAVQPSNIDPNLAKEAVMEGVFRAIQCRMIELQDGAKIANVANAILDELAESGLLRDYDSKKIDSA